MDIQTTKNELIKTVKSWVHIDNQIKQLSTMMKKLRSEKKEQNEKMIAIMKDNGIDNFDIKDGQIQYKKYSKRETLTQKKLMQILLNHPQIQEEQAQLLNDFIYENRKIEEKDIIIRKMNK